MIEWLYSKIFIAIVPEGENFDVRVVTFKRKKLLTKENKYFEGQSSFEMMMKFLRKQIQESPLHYIAILNPDAKQGALSGCSFNEFDNVLTVCRKNKWHLYTSLQEVETLKKTYSDVGIDFIFSPFSVIEHFFVDKIDTGFALYALAQKDSLSIAFFDEGILEYAHHYPNHAKEVTLSKEEVGSEFTVGIDDELENQKGIDLDDIESLDDLDIIDELDSLSDIEDLDTLEDIVEFHEDEPTLEEKNSVVQNLDEIKQEMDHFNDDYGRFEIIQKTLEHFYASKECRNRFVETIYIADAYGSGSELKRYLEEELFLNVLIRRINVGDEVISLSMNEEEG
ncbi:hypothetical protein [Sulfuricurvum sp.]|uniref:hypothetical protein n=1 Tax=Sulfuricurvum sp. TaxID=2025608 RepID=UPI003BB6B59F